MSERIEVQKQLIEQQTKFVYYIIALCVTAIGFSIYNTNGKQLSWHHIILGMSIVSWGLSIISGFSGLKSNLRTLEKTKRHLEYIEDEAVQFTMQMQKNFKNGLLQTQEAMLNMEFLNSSLFFKRQQYSFYLGIVLFLIWHVIQMANVQDSKTQNLSTATKTPFEFSIHGEYSKIPKTVPSMISNDSIPMYNKPQFKTSENWSTYSLD